MNDKNKPKKPEIEKAIYDIGSWWFVCPVCYSILNIGENCQTCKQVIDWNSELKGNNSYADGERVNK